MMEEVVDSREVEEVNREKHVKKIRTGDTRVDATTLREKIACIDQQNPDDFLGAYKSESKTLIYRDGREIDVRGLRGKTICLFFAPIALKSLLPSDLLRHFYQYLREKQQHFSFEMVYVAQPLIPPFSFRSRSGEDVDELTLFNNCMSNVPFPAVRFQDLDWRLHLTHLYFTGHSCWNKKLCVIDTSGNEVKLLNHYDDHILHQFGPLLYPFTPERPLQLREQFYQLGAKESIVEILGSDSRNYLFNRHRQPVLLSSLENKDVALYAYYKADCFDQQDVIKELELIHSQTSRDHFEIVFINMQHSRGYEDETSLYDATAKMPWLVLPFDDEKIWNLQDMMLSLHYFSKGVAWDNQPILFIKPKGKARLDPYGYQVLKKFGGIASYPFTRRKASSIIMDRLGSVTWDSFFDQVKNLDLDFSNLIQNKSNTETVEVPLANVFPSAQGRGVLLLFAKMDYFSRGRLKSLIKAYSKAKQSPSSSFEVIFVSLDFNLTDEQFCEHFSGESDMMMPWHAVKKPLSIMQHSNLFRSTLGFHIPLWRSHFIAFGCDGCLLRVGITTSFDNCDFPFINDDDYTDHIYRCVTTSYDWAAEADHTEPLRKNVGLWNTSIDQDDSDGE